MSTEYYPWGGEFITPNPKGTIAVVLLTTQYTPPNTIAIYGPLRTENIGVEKIVANTISNPHIRHLIICGQDIRGHQSGKSLIALHQNGIDENHRIINAPGAIPYIENIDTQAITRFQQQITLHNYIGCQNPQELNKKISELQTKKSKPFGEPYIAIKIVSKQQQTISDARALHSRITINYLGKITKRKE